MKTNNRRNARVRCGHLAKAEGPKGPIRGKCRNLSLGGMFFIGGQLPVGKQFEFSIELPQGKVSGTGEVKYHHTYAEEGQGMGVRFTRINQEDLARVEAFVQGAEGV